mgnify:CR=1 FL=1
MIKKSNIAFLFILLGLGYYVTISFLNNAPPLSGKENVLDILNKLGDEMPLHYIPTTKLDSNKIKEGYNLVTRGFTNPTEKKLFENPQSRHFVCTDCHNIQQEDPDLKESDPETRLAYVAERKIKFLPGTTLYGTVNKNHWYNEDYFNKYGDLVVPARDTLENAIQLCAVVCSQGRALTDIEMESVMHFLNSIGYTTKDLNMSKIENQHVSRTFEIKNPKSDLDDAARIIKSKYLDYSPATFMKPQSIEKRGFGKTGNIQRGKQIYELSCLTCHKEGGVTNYKLHDDKLTHKHLKYWSNTHKVFSVYDITRKGTYSKNGYKPYMPNYTKERLSDQQLEDLMAYINAMAKDGTIKKKYRTIGTPSF